MRRIERAFFITKENYQICAGDGKKMQINGDYGLRTQRGGRQRGILIRLAIAVVYDNRVQYSYSFCLICAGDACDAKRQLVMHHVFNNLCLQYCTHCT